MFLHLHDASPLVASLRHTIFHSPQPPTQDRPLEPETAARHMIGGVDKNLLERSQTLFTGAWDASGVNGHSCPENEQRDGRNRREFVKLLFFPSKSLQYQPEH